MQEPSRPLALRDERDRTPLRTAVRHNQMEMVKHLLQLGARLEADLLAWIEEHRDELDDP